MSRSIPVVGIDHGAASSRIAVMSGDRPLIIHANDASDAIPSAVYIDKHGRFLIGHAARMAMIAGAYEVGEGHARYKHYLGGPERFEFRAAHRFLSATELAEVVIGELLKAYRFSTGLRADAAVIAVPCHFDASANEHTLLAAKLAGLRNASVVPEPIAAALAYGFNSAPSRDLWLVVDVGARMLNLALVGRRDDNAVVVASRGDPSLGGDSLTLRLLDHALRQLELASGLPLAIPQGDLTRQAGWFKLWLASEDAKIALAKTERASIRVDQFPLEGGRPPVDIDVEILRPQHEALIAEDIARCAHACDDIVMANRTILADVSRVVIVGGGATASLCHALRERLGRRYDINETVDDPNSSTAIARGAVIHGAMVERLRHPTEGRSTSTASRPANATRDGDAAGARTPRTSAASSPIPPLDAQPCETNRAYDQDVQFTVYRPRSVIPFNWYTLLAFAHLSDIRKNSTAGHIHPLEEVRRQAAVVLGSRYAEFHHSTDESRLAIPRDGEITMALHLPGFDCTPPRVSFLWIEDVHRCEFQIRANAQLDGSSVRGSLVVFLGCLLLAEIVLRIDVDGSANDATALHGEWAHVRPYAKIFPSYSRKNVAIVEHLERTFASLGHEYVRDVNKLRAGEHWQDGLAQLIREADVFQLFWSQDAMHSPIVRKEYEYALSLRRPHFVRPCYWEDPFPESTKPVLPPAALRRLHFHKLVLNSPPGAPPSGGKRGGSRGRGRGRGSPVRSAERPSPAVRSQHARLADEEGRTSGSGAVVQCPRCGEQCQLSSASISDPRPASKCSRCSLVFSIEPERGARGAKAEKNLSLPFSRRQDETAARGKATSERRSAAIGRPQARKQPRSAPSSSQTLLQRARAAVLLGRNWLTKGARRRALELSEDTIIEFEAEAKPPVVVQQAPPSAAGRPPRRRQVKMPFSSESGYSLPDLSHLDDPPAKPAVVDHEALIASSRVLETKLGTFEVLGKVREIHPGPVITTYEFEPAPGIKVNRIVPLADDLAMAMSALSVRIVAPIPGKSVVGIEVSNKTREKIPFREIVDSDAFRESPSLLTLALGKDTKGNPVVGDLARMPHLLVAGTTGTGKSVFLNSLLSSILIRATPRDVRLVLVDPKMLELATYEQIPHLLVPVVTESRAAVTVLNNLVKEMNDRYAILKDKGVRSLEKYNAVIAEEARKGEVIELADDEDGDEEDVEDDAPARGPAPIAHQHLPRIVVIIDELADLIMTRRDVEQPITMLAQKARAAGIHMVVATQRPSVDVITGLIKANFPSRISFKVAGAVNSRTILDAIGAERLLGNGDMLFMPPDASKLQRLHGAYISDAEIQNITDFVRKQEPQHYQMDLLQDEEDEVESGGEGSGEEYDTMYDDAVRVVTESGKASISYVQRRLQVGYNRAARMIECMEREGVVSTADHRGAREILAPQIHPHQPPPGVEDPED